MKATGVVYKGEEGGEGGIGTILGQKDCLYIKVVKICLVFITKELCVSNKKEWVSTVFIGSSFLAQIVPLHPIVNYSHLKSHPVALSCKLLPSKESPLIAK